MVGSLENEFGEGVVSENVDELQNPKLIEKIRLQFSLKFKEINKQVSALSALFDNTSLRTVNEAIEEWDKAKEAFDKKYEAAKSRANVNQQQLKQIQDTERRIGELKKIQMANRNTVSALGDPAKAYGELRARWNDAYTKKIKVLEKQCKDFSSLSNGLIKAEVKGSLDVESLKKHCKLAFTGSNIKEQKIENLCQCVLTAEDPVATWSGILTELEKLARHDPEGTDPLPACPIIDKCDFKSSEKSRITAEFDYERWLDLSLAELEFNPVFQYCTSKAKNEYIAFVDASAGQQATALFTALLNQEGAALIIDQPEDDVDSKVVKEIIERIWTAKTKRQLIFASHNANFVVNGDAELVICCDYLKAGDQTAGTIKLSGAIDNEKIRKEITTVTEGGEEAFKLRKEKYGF